MSTDQYTPSVDEVRTVWAAWSEYGGLAERTDDTTDTERYAEIDRFLARVRRDAAREAVLDLAEDYRFQAEEALSDEDMNLASTRTADFLFIRERALTEYPEETP